MLWDDLWVDVINQVVTLAAVVVGAGLSYLATAANERRRQRNDAATRWEERRVDLYADYAEVAKRILRQTSTVGKLDPSTDEFREAASRLNELEEDRSALFERMVLLGDRRTIAAAHKLNHVMWTLQSKLPGAVPYTPDWQEAPWLVALNELHASARAAVLNPKQADLSTDFPAAVSVGPVQAEQGGRIAHPLRSPRGDSTA